MRTRQPAPGVAVVFRDWGTTPALQHAARCASVPRLIVALAHVVEIVVKACRASWRSHRRKKGAGACLSRSQPRRLCGDSIHQMAKRIED